MFKKRMFVFFFIFVGIIAFSSDYSVLLFSGYTYSYTSNIGEYYEYPAIKTSFHQGDSLFISEARISVTSTNDLNIEHFSNDSTTLTLKFGTTTLPLTLKDDGLNGDLVAKDGIYTSKFTIPTTISNGTVCYVEHGAETIYKFIVDSSKSSFYSSSGKFTTLFGDNTSVAYRAYIPNYPSPYYIKYSSLNNSILVPTDLSTHVSVIRLSSTMLNPKNGIMKVSNWSTFTAKSFFANINQKDIVYFNPKGEKTVIHKDYIHIPYSSIELKKPSKLCDYSVSAKLNSSTGKFSINVENLSTHTTELSTITTFSNGSIVAFDDSNLSLKLDFYDTSLIPTYTVEVCRFATFPEKTALVTFQPVFDSFVPVLKGSLNLSVSQLNSSVTKLEVFNESGKEIYKNFNNYLQNSFDLSWNLATLKNSEYTKIFQGTYYLYFLSHNFYGAGSVVPFKISLNRYNTKEKMSALKISYSMSDTQGIFNFLSNTKDYNIDIIITDMNGIKVFEANNIALKAGISNEYSWNYTNNSGEKVHKGYYLAIVKTPEKIYSMIVGVK